MKIFNAKTNAVEEVEPIVKSDEQWRAELTPEQYKITRQAGTDAAFAKVCSVPLGADGIYQCVCCGTDLFSFHTKFESETGWPSFFQPISDLNVQLKSDSSFGMDRVEVLCARCGAHLGHVFNDGPPPTGQRFCINTTALKLADEKTR
jgi:peptide-methionine (R)-S-oxide reductase